MNKNQYIKPIQIFSFFRSVKIALKEDDIDFNLNTIFFKKIWERQPEYIQRHCNRICSEIYSNRYTFFNFKISILNNLLFNKNIDLKNINLKSVERIKKLYTKERLEKDKNTILDLKEDIDFQDINIFFKINFNDISYLYEFIQKGFISPIFWIKYYKNDYFKNLKFPESKEHEHFRKVMKILKRVITET